MNANNRSVTRVGWALSSALTVLATGCATHHVHTRTVYVPTPPPVHVTPAPAPTPPPPVVVVQPAPAPVVVIQSESDFYEPLGTYGRWEVVAGYGRCWVPTRIEVGWRPYSDGYWQRTDAGWYWVSNEPWGWATYHYGRWDWHAQFGWFWVPQTQWAPAWVCWREGGGYVGWAPLRPSVTIGVNIHVGDYEPAHASRAFVFVEHRRMLEPVRPKTVIVNNTTIINKTVNITKIKVVNKTVINEGPRPEVVERESGRKVRAVAANEARHQEETTVVARERNIPRAGEKRAESPARIETRSTPTPADTTVKAPVAVKPVDATTPATPPVKHTPPTRPVVGKAEPEDGRKVEVPAKANERERGVEAKANREPKPEQPNQHRPATPTVGRPAEVVKPTAVTPQSAPVTHTSATRPVVGKAGHEDGRKVEVPAKANEREGGFEARTKPEPKPEQPNAHRPPARTVERPAEVVQPKPVPAPVVAAPVREEVRSKPTPENVGPAATQAAAARSRNEARKEAKVETRHPARAETPTPEGGKRPSASPPVQQVQRPTAAPSQKSRVEERPEAGKQKNENKGPKKKNDPTNPSPTNAAPQR